MDAACHSPAQRYHPVDFVSSEFAIDIMVHIVRKSTVQRTLSIMVRQPSCPGIVVLSRANRCTFCSAKTSRLASWYPPLIGTPKSTNPFGFFVFEMPWFLAVKTFSPWKCVKASRCERSAMCTNTAGGEGGQADTKGPGKSAWPYLPNIVGSHTVPSVRWFRDTCRKL